MEKPYLEILIQPKQEDNRFRYASEGPMAGSILGENSTEENKTFPTVIVRNCDELSSQAVIVASLVTVDNPPLPHPHQLVGTECKKGICTVKIKRATGMKYCFTHIGVQCATKKEIKPNLEQRQQLRVDPFNTGFKHIDNKGKIDLNACRICFQGFLPDENGKFKRILQPVVSKPLYNKRSKNELIITKQSHYSGKVSGGTECIMLTEKVKKESIQIRFFEEQNGLICWTAYADFKPANIHHQVAIIYKTPPYKNPQIDKPVTVKVQLRMPPDGENGEMLSEPLAFTYVPDDGDPHQIGKKRKKMLHESFMSDDLPANLPGQSTTQYAPGQIQRPANIPQGTVLADRIKAKPAARKKNAKNMGDAVPCEEAAIYHRPPMGTAYNEPQFQTTNQMYNEVNYAVTQAPVQMIPSKSMPQQSPMLSQTMQQGDSGELISSMMTEAGDTARNGPITLDTSQLNVSFTNLLEGTQDPNTQSVLTFDNQDALTAFLTDNIANFPSMDTASLNQYVASLSGDLLQSGPGDTTNMEVGAMENVTNVGTPIAPQQAGAMKNDDNAQVAENSPDDLTASENLRVVRQFVNENFSAPGGSGQ
ncbi:unnamed protein product [Owenia fusiformis]|uniref:Uncharacterized protein n=1 Tax=Owenia fusiformis TaxID=6347 RepID=A0A8J1U5I9_OWEFU|nr:unnamed protein product [Owenia fusiformis]